MMTKLMQWLLGVGSFLAVWAAVVFELVKLDLSPTYQEIVFHLPIYLLISFACYSLAVVGYRTATFNDCPEAADELKQEIQKAKIDLKNKGVTIDS